MTTSARGHAPHTPHFGKLIVLICWLMAAGVGANALPPVTTNLTLALDAAVGVYKDAGKSFPAINTGDPVYTWADQSGNGHDVIQPALTNRPTYQPNPQTGLNSIHFGTSVFTNLSTTSLAQSSQAQTLFLVLRPYARNTQTTFVAQNALNCYQYTGLWSVWDGANIRLAGQGTVGPTQGWQLLTIVFDKTSITFRLNGGAAGFTTTVTQANPATLTSFFLGTTYTNTQAWNGDLAECLLYSAVLAGSDISAVENYLLTKYNLPPAYSPSLPLVVHEGDSLTEGVNTPRNSYEYPEIAFQALSSTLPYNYCSFAVSGSTVADMTKRAATVDALYSSSRAKNILDVWIGTNDMGNKGLTPTAAYNALVSYCMARRAVGWKVIVRTMIPRATFPDVNRLVFNNYIRTTWSTFADSLDDLGNDAQLGQGGVQSNTILYGTDQVHLTPAGYGIAANYASIAIMGLLLSK